MDLRLRFLALIVLCGSLAPGVLAQEEAPPPPVEVTHITGNLHKLVCNGNVAIIASVGEDGVLLVDSGYAATAEAVREALGAMRSGPVRLIVNTHGDGDHVGGNAVLGREATTIAHPAVRTQMGAYFSLPAVATAGMPMITLDHEATIHFNGEPIRLIPVPGGHTRGDLVVHFTASKVLCLGDLVLSGTFPNADPGRGGDAQQLLAVLKQLRESLPADTLLVPAHGANIDTAGLSEYISMVTGTTAAVKGRMKEGRTLDEIMAQNPLTPWAAFEDAERGLGYENWIRELHASLSGKSQTSINAPVTAAYVDQGIEAAVATYRRLKTEQPKEWNFGEAQLNTLGYQLLQRNLVDDAIAVFLLNVEMYPEGFNPYDSLGEAYLAAGKTDLAIASYRRSLELNPNNDNAVRVLETLKKEQP